MTNRYDNFCVDCGASLWQFRPNRKRCQECKTKNEKEREKNRPNRSEYKKEHHKKTNKTKLKQNKKWQKNNKGKVLEKLKLIRMFGTSKVPDDIKKITAIIRLSKTERLTAEKLTKVLTEGTYYAYE
jgi:hypothetical protein